MKRFAVFAILGPPIAAATFYLILLPLAGVLEGEPVVIDTPVLPVWSYAVFASLVVAVFDWVASLIEVPFRPIAAAIVGWVLAFALLRGYLALPDLPGWFAAVGMLGAIPGFVCSWVTMRVDGKESVVRRMGRALRSPSESRRELMGIAFAPSMLCAASLPRDRY